MVDMEKTIDTRPKHLPSCQMFDYKPTVVPKPFKFGETCSAPSGNVAGYCYDCKNFKNSRYYFYYILKYYIFYNIKMSLIKIKLRCMFYKTIFK